MVLRSPKTAIALCSITLVLLVIKLFTTTIAFTDDPTSLLVIEYTPSFTNSFIVESITNASNYKILFSDENGLWGENIYFLIVDYIWWCFPLLSATFYFSRNHSKQRV